MSKIYKLDEIKSALVHDVNVQAIDIIMTLEKVKGKYFLTIMDKDRQLELRYVEISEIVYKSILRESEDDND